jgi:NADPH:quinone reductase-like Zn-dependent oxidoreductase
MSENRMMRGAVITAHGGTEVVDVIDTLPYPDDIPAGYARVKIGAAALNRLDLWVRTGWDGLKLAFPHVVAADGAGVVDAVGAGVTNVRVGARVSINPTVFDRDCLERTGSESECLDIAILGEHAPGVASEYAVVQARQLHALPDHVPFADAAAAGLVYLTAWHMLIGRAALQAGESVLIVGAGGGVNTASIQIAKRLGCTVYVVGSNADKCAAAAALGADVTVDRSVEPNWAKVIYGLTNKRGVDVVVDNVGKDTLPSSLRAARRGGRIAIVGNTSGYAAQLDTRFIFGKHLSIVGSSMGTTAEYRRVMDLIAAGALKPVIDQVYPLAEARAAFARLESGLAFGKLVLDLT